MPFNYGVKKKNGGLSRARSAELTAEYALDLAADLEARGIEGTADPIIARAEGAQALRLGKEALSIAREARAKALRRRH
jgi:hypothetical protein